MFWQNFPYISSLSNDILSYMITKILIFKSTPKYAWALKICSYRSQLIHQQITLQVLPRRSAFHHQLRISFQKKTSASRLKKQISLFVKPIRLIRPSLLNVSDAIERKIQSESIRYRLDCQCDLCMNINMIRVSKIGLLKISTVITLYTGFVLLQVVSLRLRQMLYDQHSSELAN